MTRAQPMFQPSNVIGVPPFHTELWEYVKNPTFNFANGSLGLAVLQLEESRIAYWIIIFWQWNFIIWGLFVLANKFVSGSYINCVVKTENKGPSSPLNDFGPNRGSSSLHNLLPNSIIPEAQRQLSSTTAPFRYIYYCNLVLCIDYSKKVICIENHIREIMVNILKKKEIMVNLASK